MMYEYCAKRGVKHQQVGKLLVAADEKQVARLKHYIQNGAENKVELRVGSSLPLFRLAKNTGLWSTGFCDSQPALLGGRDSVGGWDKGYHQDNEMSPITFHPLPKLFK
jgi:hypothetical protein